MARNIIYTITLLKTRALFAPGTVFRSYWDDVDEAIEVTAATSYTTEETDYTPGSVPTLGTENTDYTRVDHKLVFCDGTTQIYFTPKNNGPYAVKKELLNSPLCQVGAACDIEIADNPVITKASSESANDGALEITVTSTNGIIKVALFDFDYATEGTTVSTGAPYTFSNLVPGQYTVYAKDEGGCVDIMPVRISYEGNYQLRYVSEWKDIHANGTNGFDHKIEILELDYSGDTETLLADNEEGSPFTRTLHASGENKFYTIRATSISFRFITTTSFGYENLFAENERQFQVKHYIDFGSGYEMDFKGYQIPFLWNAQYIKEPYTITIEATDGLANLKDLDFVDESGNNYRTSLPAIEIIASIVRKLDLEINIRSAINMYEDTFDATDADGPLAQAHYDTSVFYDKDKPWKCDEVLISILQEYRGGACIAQADGKWVVWCPEELTGDTVDYREFTEHAVYDSNGSLDAAVDIDWAGATDRLVFADQSAVMDMLPSYGKIIITQKLIAKKSLLRSYSFEETDLPPANLLQFFRGWNVLVVTGTNITWGHEDVDRGESKGALYVNFNHGDQAELLIYNVRDSLMISNTDWLLFGFDYLVDQAIARPYTRFRYKLKIGDYYYNTIDLGENWSSSDPGYNEIYFTEYNAWKTYEFRIPMVQWPGDSSDDQDIEFYMLFDNQWDEDHGSLASLKGEVTMSKHVAVRRVVKDGDVYRFYKSRYSQGGANEPELVYPNDYSSTAPVNITAWEQTDEIDSSLPSTRGFLIDNVILRVLPDGLETKSENVIPIVLNKNNKRVYELTIHHGDCPTDIINAKYAYTNYIRDQNGNPTSAWTRDGFPESQTIQSILLASLAAQFKKSSRRLTGTLIGDKYLKPYSVLREQGDSGRRYLCQGYDQLANINEYVIDGYELKNPSGSDSVVPFSGAFDPQAFGIDYD
ncbi:MAG TPA: hypothetical protein VD927_06615 [Chryseosolibacter sp.]|nr:hypothetical protein [Chryseosolibacter sp.]